MNKIFNIGVLGCANIAVRSVIPTLLELPNQFKLFGIASRSLEKAQELASMYNTNAYEGYESLIEQKELEAIYIPLPNGLHAKWIEKALKNDKHVLVEKSLACTYEEVKRLNKIAKSRNLALIENFQFRFHSQLKYIRDLVDSGKIGDLRCLRSSFGFPSLPSNEDIRYQKELGGGALLDVGAYPLKISQIFLGKDIEVKAANLNNLEGYEVDIWGGAYVTQKKGPLFGELAFGFNHFYQCNIELWGSHGKIMTNRIFTAKKDYEPIVEVETNAGLEKIVLTPDHHFMNMLSHFYKCMIDNELLKEEYSQNINQARLINEVKIKNRI